MAENSVASPASLSTVAETNTSTEKTGQEVAPAAEVTEAVPTTETDLFGNGACKASELSAQNDAAQCDMDSGKADSADGSPTEGSATQTDSAGGEQQLSKNQLRKLRYRERQVAARRARRSEEKRRRRERDAAAQSAAAAAGQMISKRDRRRAELDRLRAARQDGLPVCVDLQYGDRMTEKEQSRLATQLGRLYGANRSAARPLRLLLTSLAEDGPLHQRCRRLVDGFDRLELERCAEPPHRLFAAERLVYLSPDGETELKRLDEQAVYVIGGLVDETVQSGVTRAAAAAAGVRTARLPTAAYLQHEAGTRACVLTVNQVFEILLRFRETGDWTAALTAAVPARKGFTPKSDDAAAKGDSTAAANPPPVGAE
ncbi:tRNA methyltransferase 10 homolog B-like isoform X1 [Amphibalanus amphitrite]|uniref:tRNA methyltransferase 10 homolog B-like isoform X1 n=1 Tax=Amphibalanus amphitrite TaxID=1232801 RepID=UPI001C923BF3|nr:tRNA methyltransferase 10 homolog B-like isoform X1 [Amphibalanus amphitrite]XP_043194948.1 tRNA methyltransferase 10 homolog B-like isoform X1 [Amphibalanus amphitrite]